jgi:spermidine dehydrogenase
MSWTDKELGMDRRITRRDFMQGAAMAVAVTITPQNALFAQTAAEPQNALGYDPPALHGMRGSHPGAFEVAHSLRDGTFWSTAGSPETTGETYDLVVVGGGISGLSSARFFHQAAGKAARVLILENHDDFGGHAKRNEFQVDKNFMLTYGGTYAIESPGVYSSVAKGVIRDLGIDVSSYSRHNNEKVFDSLGLKDKIFFDRETFGADRLADKPPFGRSEDAAPPGSNDWKKFAAQTPLTERSKADIQRLYALQDDLLPGLSSDQKKAKLARMSYADYLTDIVQVDPQVVAMLQSYPKPYYGLGIDAVSAQDAWGQGLPGFNGLKLTPEPGPGMGRDAIYNQQAKDYFFHFPDGNATIARLLARGLVPAAISGHTVNDVVRAQVRYGRLDQPRNATRIRLNSTVVKVRHDGDPATAKEVEVSYVQKGQLYTVRAAHCILACWHPVIPYIAAELPPAQLSALKHAEKVPLVYSQVALTNWESFVRLKMESMHAPGSYYSETRLDYRVSIGNYHCTKKPGQPIVVTMEHYPCKPGLPGRQQHRAGRAEVYGTPFETFERNLREQLARSVGAGGFDPQRDIAAITVNRWPHGYAYQYNSLWDPFWLEGGPQPCVEARKPFGRIAIANADADAYAYTDCAINQAYRAVNDLKIDAL